MTPGWDELILVLELVQRWAVVSVLVLALLWLVHRLNAAWGHPLTPWPWWLPLLIGALLTAASMVGTRCPRLVL